MALSAKEKKRAFAKAHGLIVRKAPLQKAQNTYTRTEGNVQYQYDSAAALAWEKWAREQRDATGRLIIPFGEYYRQLTREEKLAITVTTLTSFEK